MVFGAGWHTDSPFLPNPPSITILRSVEVPAVGGDTIWANCALAYAMLSDAYKAMIADLTVRFSMRDVLRAVRDLLNRETLHRTPRRHRRGEPPRALRRKVEGSVHPMVRTHSVTGEKALYVDDTYALGIEGMSEEESRPILAYLASYIVQHEFTCRLRWEPDMVVLWDNQSCVHQAFNDYDGHRREMYRTTVVSEASA